MEITDLYQEITGVAYWWLPTNTLGVPEAIWILQSQLVTPKVSEGGKLLHYEYGKGSNKMELPVEEVLPFYFPNLDNPYTSGYAPTRAAYEAIRLQEANASHQAALLNNNARPDMVVSAKAGGLGGAESERLERRFNRKFRKGGSGGVLFLGDDVDLTPIGYPPRDMQASLLDDRARRSIANAYGVPLSLLQTENVNRANADAGFYQLARMATLPRCRRMDQRLTQRFLPRWDESGRLFLMFDNPVPEDREFFLKKREVDMKNGVMLINEARQEDGLDPIEGGDKPLLPMSLLPLGSPRPEAAAPAAEEEGEKAVKRPFARPLPQGTALAEALRIQFRRQRIAMLRRFKAITKAEWTPPEGLFDNADWAAWDREMADAARGHLEGYADTGARSVKNSLMSEFPGEYSSWEVPSIKINEAMDRASFAFSESTNATTRMALDKALVDLRGELVDGVLTGETAQGALTGRVNEIFQDAETYRAQRIATTETSRAIHEGERIAAIDSGVATGFEWILSADACPICLAIAAENPVIGVHGAFAVQGTGPYGTVEHPPAHPNCMCSMGVTFDTTGLEVPESERGQEPIKVDGIPTKANGRKWTNADADVVANYTQSDFLEITGAQRGDPWVNMRGTRDQALARGKRVEQALEKLPATQGEVYRGMTFRSAEQRAKFLADFKPGSAYRAESFQSASTSRKVATDFMLDFETTRDKYTMLEIQSKTGRDIASLASNPAEAEVLFMKGATFNVVSVTKRLIKLVEM